ncbi:LytR/AlgR family response regulator transcription factor [Tenacibaculum sp. ZS6-P6]|uniref:LytR/AlgR family response regulator transcription factor n=1 Tax=Tenacibaculum sp. ZS6-P6 TaxID=3447503 RepID=UPI003F9BAEC8
MIKKINCIIIDDEPSSQNVLEQFVKKIDFLELKAVCNHAQEAQKVIEVEKVDLLFLDINMPIISGLDFYKSLINPPLVIFTTAYAEFAVEGFDVNATDYLLKPFSFERFQKAVIKAKDILKQDEDKLILKADKRLHIIKFEDILFVQSLGDYVKVHTTNNTLTTYSKLSTMIEKLPSNNFIQVHKSYAINIQKVNFIEGNHLLISEHKIPIGQKHKQNLTKHLNNY